MTPRDPSIEPHELATMAARIADDKHGTDIVVLDVGDVLAVADHFVITSASNQRLVRTITEEIEVGIRDRAGRSPVRTEGANEQQWVLIDYGDVVVHVFLAEVRAYYEIERLYRDVPTVEWRPDVPSDPAG